MARKQISAADSKQRETTAKTLIAVRNALKITQSDMAKTLDCDRKTVQRYENCLRELDAKILSRFAKPYGIDPYLPYEPQKHLLKPLSPPKTPISPDNQLIVMCRGCGENQHVSQTDCDSCSAHLAGQVSNQCSEWGVAEANALVDGIRKAGRQSAYFLFFSLGPIGVYLYLLSLDETHPLMMSYFKIAWPIVMITSVGSFAASMALDRRKKRLEKRLQNLSYDDFLRSAHFKTLSRPRKAQKKNASV